MRHLILTLPATCLACVAVAVVVSEARWLSPFVSYYNRDRGREFAFLARLDATGPMPQPEASYRDPRDGKMLVIERKALIWPATFAQLHATSHMVAEIVKSVLAEAVDSSRGYRCALRDDLRGSRDDLQMYARSVAEMIVNRLGDVHSGHVIGGDIPGREWSFREEFARDRDFTEPDTGVILEFHIPPSELDYGVVSDGFVREFQRLLDAAAKKFVSYQGATRILVITPGGDVRLNSKETWSELLTRASIAGPIDEIWLSMHDMLTELHCGWIHRELWPTSGDDHSELCHDPELCESGQSDNPPPVSG